MPGPEIPAVNEALNACDEDCHFNGNPLLSALVVHEDGTPCSTFITNIDRFKLRREGESNVEARERIAEECYVRYGGKVG